MQRSPYHGPWCLLASLGFLGLAAANARLVAGS